MQTSNVKEGNSMDIFGFLKTKPTPGDIARERLKVVLIHDRSNCSPRVIEALKADIIRVISIYMEIDEDDVDIQIYQKDTDESNFPILLANIPIKAVRKVPVNP